MPQIFRIGSYVVYFWINEGAPLEPVHIHVSQGVPTANSTKIWITRSGKCLLCNNNSRIPSRILHYVEAVVEARADEICEKWTDTFGEIRYYC